MNSLNQIKNNFYKDGFVHVKKLFNKRNIQDIFNQINEIKNKSIEEIILKSSSLFSEIEESISGL